MLLQVTLPFKLVLIRISTIFIAVPHWRACGGRGGAGEEDDHFVGDEREDAEASHSSSAGD